MPFNISAFIPDAIKNFLNGQGTYLTGVTAILLSVMVMSGVDVSMIAPITIDTAPQIFMIGLSSILLRRGITNEAKKAKE